MQKSASFMTNHPRVHNKGFTLLETLIYIALLGMLLTGVLLTAYPLFTGAERITKNVTAEGEAAFILRKISWALSSATSVSVPNSTTLTIQHASAGQLKFDLNVDSLELNDTFPLNASRAPVTSFSVTNTPASGGTPRYIAPAEVARIVALMWRYRGARGVYGESGCVDTTREFPRWVHPGTADLVLPLQ